MLQVDTRSRSYKKVKVKVIFDWGRTRRVLPQNRPMLQLIYELLGHDNPTDRPGWLYKACSCSFSANGHVNMSVFQTPDRATGCAQNVNSAGWFLSSANNNSCYRSILFGSFDGTRTDVTWEATSASVVYVDMKYRASTFRTGTRLNVLETINSMPFSVSFQDWQINSLAS